MGSSQSLSAEIALTGLVLAAGAYFFASKPLTPPVQQDSGTGKSSENRKNTKTKKKKTNNTASSIETLVDESAAEQVTFPTYDERVTLKRPAHDARSSSLNQRK